MRDGLVVEHVEDDRDCPLRCVVDANDAVGHNEPGELVFGFEHGVEQRQGDSGSFANGTKGGSRSELNAAIISLEFGDDHRDGIRGL